ncbi:glycosyltransferase family 2 protein [Modestobacter versicolor]|uniref:glycosyltransferase family 2 protein n=1 Tax=Modestobacter versicolor TaxID=429133 RepID=UPI0034E04247
MATSAPLPEVTVVVVTWQGAHLLGPCLESLRRQTLPHAVLVVDNGSTDGTEELLAARFPEVEVLQTGANLGFAGGAQSGLDAARTPFVALLNNDAVAEPGWLAALAGHLAAHPGAAAVTSRMLLQGTDPPLLNNTGVVLLPDDYGADRDLRADAGARPNPGPVFGFSGGAALLRRSAVEQVGGFARRFFLYYEDTDLSWRLRLAGWDVRYEPAAVVHHAHSATVDQTSTGFAFHNERNRLLMLTRCAPAGRALRALLRFVLTTGSLAVSRLRGREVPDVPVFSTRLRLRVLGSYLRLLPWGLRTRRAVRAGAGAEVSGRA